MISMRSLTVYIGLLYICLTTLVYGQASFDPSDFDWSVRPTDDFFAFVNGEWMNRTQIPPSLTLWGGMFSMEHKISLQLKHILDELLNNDTLSAYPIDSVNRKLTDLYLAGLNKATVEHLGLQPVEEALLQLHRVNTYQELIALILNWYKRTNKGLIFEFHVFADRRNSSTNIPIWKQTGLMLEERNLYFQNDPKSKLIRSKFVEYIDHLLQLSNYISNVTTNMIDAEDVLSLEMQLAAAHQIPTELRDAENTYNRYSVEQLAQMMPNLDWRKIFKILGIKRSIHLVNQPDYYQLLDRLIVNQPLSTWKNKIRVHMIHEMASYLNQDVQRAHFEVFDRLLYGRQEPQPRWRKIVDDINHYVGEMLGRLYVSRYFSEESKQKILTIVFHLMDVYRQRIINNRWMTASTKEKAIAKLKKMKAKIGYPSTWKTYDSIKIDPWKYYDSMCNIFEYIFREKIDDLDQPAKRDEWFIPPQTSNAFYNLLFNEIVYPAGILQEPYFSLDADDAINYGAAGFSIAHELTHGFDDQGKKYDENGELRSWWSKRDTEEFQSRARLLVEQYNNYEIMNISINGRLTLGENIADLGGVEIAFDAFSQTPEAKENRIIDGFTAKQRFFLAYARTWRIKMTDARMLHSIQVDRHAPPSVRTNGPLTNSDGFYQAFGVRAGDRMYREPAKRVQIW